MENAGRLKIDFEWEPCILEAHSPRNGGGRISVPEFATDIKTPKQACFYKTTDFFCLSVIKLNTFALKTETFFLLNKYFHSCIHYRSSSLQQ